ncbi:MAG: DUF2139 domain-containing protein [Nitrososphaeria archaeon]
MVEEILSRFHRFTPRYGPEWGSGGIYGLRYYKRTLYFNVAFEAEAHLIHEDQETVYCYDQVGPKPVSGGDTYNAVDTVDDCIYFGGWVHAPAAYNRTEQVRGISFVNKYSHVHQYDIRERKVRLIWKDSIHCETEWAGEVSEIVYDPVGDRLLLARADGHSHLGIFALDRRHGTISQLSGDPGIKGTLFLDTACFDKSNVGDLVGLQYLDLSTNRWSKQEITDISKISLDGENCIRPSVGCMTSAYARLFVFIKGGILLGNPLVSSMEPMNFVRLFDFVHSGYSPSRTVALPIGGGVLTAFNAFTHGLINPMNENEVRAMETMNTIVGPSVLVYVTPPIARIVGALGARITSMESLGDRILVGTSTTANLARSDATPIDAGHRDLLVFDHDILFSPPPAVTFTISGNRVSNLKWGGIPLFGYKDKTLTINATKGYRLSISEYDVTLPVRFAQEDHYQITRGKNVIDLKAYNRIVSFKLEEADPNAIIHLSLS